MKRSPGAAGFPPWMCGEAALVEHAKVAGERFQPGCVAGCGDDGVCVDAGPVGEDWACIPQRCDAGGDLDPAGCDGVDDLLVQDRGCLAVAPQAGEDPVRWRGKTVRAQVADGQPPDQSCLVVGDAGGEPQRCDCREVAGQPPDWRSIRFGWVRTATHTRSAPPSARS